MEHILDPDSPLAPSVRADSHDLAFIDDGPLFGPSPSPITHVSPTPAPPTMEVLIELPAPAAAPGVIMVPDEQVLVQDGTPEPEMVHIASGRHRGQLRLRPPKGYQGNRCCSCIQTSIRSLLLLPFMPCFPSIATA